DVEGIRGRGERRQNIAVPRNHPNGLSHPWLNQVIKVTAPKKENPPSRRVICFEGHSSKDLLGFLALR
ncbi:hypothetical protein ACX6VM_004880, partial [Enterobacter hormaechei]